ncbi:Photosystem II Pbs27 [Sesbania bispinosa]|nr:Photosystem II Pbs27 [Sesbania bispinosa]
MVSFVPPLRNRSQPWASQTHRFTSPPNLFSHFVHRHFRSPATVVRRRPLTSNVNHRPTTTAAPDRRTQPALRLQPPFFNVDHRSPSPATVLARRKSQVKCFKTEETIAALCTQWMWLRLSIAEIHKVGWQLSLQQICVPLSNIALLHLEASSSRRHVLVSVGTSLVTMTCCCLSPPMVLAEEKSADKEEDDKGVIGAIKSLFDPNEKTKSGKVLPKAYLKSAREVVKTLRESLNEAPDDIAKFRRTADAAKESIREYLGSWRGQQTVVKEESYVVLEKAIRSLANFYSRAGPSAPMPEEVKSEILDYLNTAEEFL